MTKDSRQQLKEQLKQVKIEVTVNEKNREFAVFSVPRTASRGPQPFDQADDLVEVMPFIPAVAVIAAIVAIITTITIHAARPDPRVLVAGNHSHTSDGL